MTDSGRSSTVASRYAHLAELCRDSASKSWSPVASAELEALAQIYDRKATAVQALPDQSTKPAEPRKSNRVTKIQPVEILEDTPIRSAFRFADFKRKRSLGATSAVHGSD